MSASTATQRTKVVGAPTECVRVLVAEDDVQLRTLIVRHLRGEGLDVDEASNGDITLDLITRSLCRDPPHPYDLLITDIRMPGYTTGLEVLAAIRALDWRMPVIVITGFGDEEAHEEAARLGAFALFDKPFDLDDLGTAVVNALPAPR